MEEKIMVNTGDNGGIVMAEGGTESISEVAFDQLLTVMDLGDELNDMVEALRFYGKYALEHFKDSENFSNVGQGWYNGLSLIVDKVEEIATIIESKPKEIFKTIRGTLRTAGVPDIQV